MTEARDEDVEKGYAKAKYTAGEVRNYFAGTTGPDIAKKLPHTDARLFTTKSAAGVFHAL